MNSSRFARSIVIACLAAAAIAQAKPALAIVASNYTGGGTLANFDNATGWYFTPNVNIVVTSLGLYDHDTGGFTESHDVGIFLNNGSPVITTSLGSGLSGTFVPGTVNGSRVVAIAPTLLSAGTTYYTLANNFSVDQYAYGTDAVTYAPQINWLGFCDGFTNSITSPVTFYGGFPGDTGPNFLFTVVPEPASILLLVAGLMLANCSRPRRGGCNG